MKNKIKEDLYNLKEWLEKDVIISNILFIFGVMIILKLVFAFILFDIEKLYNFNVLYDINIINQFLIYYGYTITPDLTLFDYIINNAFYIILFYSVFSYIKNKNKSIYKKLNKIIIFVIHLILISILFIYVSNIFYFNITGSNLTIELIKDNLMIDKIKYFLQIQPLLFLIAPFLIVIIYSILIYTKKIYMYFFILSFIILLLFSQLEMTTTSLVKSQLLKTNIIYNLFFIDKLKKEELDKINKFFIEKENELNKEIKYTNKKEKIEEPNKIYFFFLESIRRDYLKEMLFLKEIEENSIIFKNNYSSYSGTDYTVLSSLYGEKIFTLKKNKKNIKPIISNFKEKGYNLEHYQPQTIKTFPFYFKNSLDFLKENGKVYGADEIETISTFYKDEEKTINKMINNSIKNKGKEILVYLSYINHFPYFTYEKDMEYYPNKEKSFEQYKKSIKKMDNILINTIKRIKKEQPTAMMIFVPDHGQAFGEKGRYTHGFNDNEVIDNQVYIYHKDITKNIITENTSHYNILPTVYDTMYGTTSKNSIYNDFSKYITIFSNQELTLINNRLNIKETLLYNKSCKRFDLFKDQKELNQLECKELKQFQK